MQFLYKNVDNVEYKFSPLPFGCLYEYNVSSTS